MKRVFNFAMPFLQASLVKQILVGLVLGIALAYAAPAVAVSCGFLGTVFVTALKAVAPILVFVLVMMVLMLVVVVVSVFDFLNPSCRACHVVEIK